MQGEATMNTEQQHTDGPATGEREEVVTANRVYRARLHNGVFEVERYRLGGFSTTSEGVSLHEQYLVQVILKERAATRNRELVLAELLTEWGARSDHWKQLAGMDHYVARYGAIDDCINDLRATLSTDTTARVDAMRQQRAAVKVLADAANNHLLWRDHDALCPALHDDAANCTCWRSEVIAALGQLEAATGGEVEGCNHEWVDMSNQVIKSGEMCQKCGLLREPTI